MKTKSVKKALTDKKPIFSSSTVWAGSVGLVVFALRIFKGWELDADETRGIIEHLDAIKGSVIGLVASGGIIYSRVKAINFDKSIFKSKTFWASVGQGVGILLAAFGGGETSGEDLKELASGSFDTVTLTAGTLTAVMAVYGRLKADTPLTIKRAEIVED